MRCKACNEIIKYVSYRKRVERLEDLCLTCRQAIDLAPTTEETVLELGYTEVNHELD